jgi:predicted Rossmann fold nucleotide-binding protein DprA/Smf involved in DNA uptake
MMELTAKLYFTNGARSFALLAGSDHDAGDRGAAFRAAAQRVRDTRERLRASLTALEACNLPAPVAQALFKKQTFWRAANSHSAHRLPFAALARTRMSADAPRDLRPAVVRYVRGDVSVLNGPSLSIVGTRRPTVRGRRWQSAWAATWPSAVLPLVEGQEHSGSLITARLAMGLDGRSSAFRALRPGRQLCPQPVDQAGSQKLVTSAEDVIEELPTPVRTALVQAEVVGSEERNSLMENCLTLT